MPEPLVIPTPGTGVSVMAALADEAVMNVILTGMATAAASHSSNRVTRADQLSADSSALWNVAQTTPTIYAGMGFRVAQQSGGYPADTGTGTGGGKAA